MCFGRRRFSFWFPLALLAGVCLVTASGSLDELFPRDVTARTVEAVCACGLSMAHSFPAIDEVCELPIDDPMVMAWICSAETLVVGLFVFAVGWLLLGTQA